ncbi:MAG: polysaccharide deacetylase family protein [Victivallales bacterium]|nr:polysaccharide deacetylase family protein [Victivallales bacterium]
MKILQIVIMLIGLFVMQTKAVEKIDLDIVKHGIVCFTFDDSHYHGWLQHIELFRQYDAHATFFYNGKITPEMISSMKTLQKHGHSIGLHTVSHKDAVPHMAEMGAEAYIMEQIMPQLQTTQGAEISINAFAYPNNRRTEFTDKALTPYFKYLRAGIPSRPQKGFWIAGQDDAYVPLRTISTKMILPGVGIGAFYSTTLENLDAALKRCADKNELLIFFSHNIASNAGHVHMPTETLHHCLKKAQELKIRVIGIDELPDQ